MPDHFSAVKESKFSRNKAPNKKKKNLTILEAGIKFLTEVPTNKKIKGGKRTVDAVTGPKHKKVKPKRLEPTIGKAFNVIRRIFK